MNRDRSLRTAMSLIQDVQVSLNDPKQRSALDFCLQTLGQVRKHLREGPSSHGDLEHQGGPSPLTPKRPNPLREEMYEGGRGTPSPLPAEDYVDEAVVR